MEIEIIERDLTDNKLFYRTNSALVEAQKVIIKVASLQKDKDEGRGGGRILFDIMALGVCAY